jgi:threonine synthase
MTTFSSTRGGDNHRSFCDAFLAGYAADGGMFMPDQIPPLLTPATLAAWRGRSYQELVVEVLSAFVSPAEIPPADLQALVATAFQHSNFPNRLQFGPDIVNMRRFAGADPAFALLELWSGHTLAFKDLGMAFAGCLLEYLVQRHHQVINVLVATSGDTGSAALWAVANKAQTHIFVLYPGGGRISAQQELQMTTVIAPNCHVIAIDGTSDDADVVLQELFADPAVRERYRLTSINSVNIARILIQIVHFIWAYLHLSAAEPSITDFCFAIPSGGLGNATSGLIARLMGLPVSFLLSVNANKTLDTFTRTGVLHGHPTVIQTRAPSMDIAVPYNLERILYLLTDRDGPLVASWMQELQRTGSLQLPDDLLQRFRAYFDSQAISDATILATIQQTYSDFQYVLDPHTAVAVAALAQLPAAARSARSFCVVATAHWSKFQSAIEAALGADRFQLLTTDLPLAISELPLLPRSSIVLPDRTHWARDLRKLIATFNPSHSASSHD